MELKKCPFCGGEADLHQHLNDKTWHVCCMGMESDCILETIDWCASFPTEQKAIEAWNKRIGEE